MRLIEGVKIRQIAGQAVLMPAGKAVRYLRRTVVLNKEGAFFAGLMQEDFTRDDLIKAGLEKYSVSEAVLREDIQRLVDELIKLGFVQTEGFACGVADAPKNAELPPTPVFPKTEQGGE